MSEAPARHEVSAGGLVYRVANGVTEVLIIEDRYGKVTLPKGHQEAGETLEETALREIREETSVLGRIEGEPLGRVTYEFETDGVRVIKDVYYFLVLAVGGEPRADTTEIASTRWIRSDELSQLQRTSGYDNNTIIVERGVHRLIAHG